MNIFPIFTFLLFSVSSHKLIEPSNKVWLECYVSSRTGFGWGAYSNLYNFPHMMKSFKVGKFDATYVTMCNVDSIHELYYFSDSIENIEVYKGGKTSRKLKKKFGLPRIEFILHKNFSTEICQVDNNFIIRKDKSYFIMSDTLKELILNHLPCELKQDWLQDYTIE